MKRFIIWMGVLLAAPLWALNINTATADELSALKGIGEVTAEKIIEYRDKHTFKRIDELMNIKGIGQKKFDKIKADLSV